MAKKRVDPTSWTVDVCRSGDTCLVNRGQLPVIPDDTVIIRNSTGDRMTAFFPDGNLFHQLEGKPKMVDIPDGGQSEFKVKGKGLPNECKRYPYAVFCHVTGDFAIANSNPEIIIDW